MEKQIASFINFLENDKKLSDNTLQSYKRDIAQYMTYINSNNLDFKKMLNHWKTIRTHRKWVRHYCKLAGIYWRGIKHDLSKYSPNNG